MGNATRQFHPLPCPQCRQTLFLVFEGEPAMFHCAAGHEATIGDLLRGGLPEGEGQDESVLRHWSERESALLEMSRGAQRSGQARQAAELQEAARQIQERLKSATNSAPQKW